MLDSITPQGIDVLYPIAFIGSYVMLRRYRDPMRCGNDCLHLPGCRFQKKGGHDPRGFTSSVPVAPVEHSRTYIIYMGIGKVALALGSVATLMPAIFFSAYHLRKIRVGFEKCNCTHAKSCPLGVTQFRPPDGCDGWIYRAGGYDSPDLKKWVEGIKVPTSSARVMSAQAA
jgi:hypothetical protein